jgi:hypothetical protein
MQTSHIPPFGVRMDSRLKDWLKLRAAQNKRSANSEIVLRLEESRERELQGVQDNAGKAV